MILIFLAGILLLGGGFAFYYSRHWKNGIRARLSIERDCVYAGEQTAIVETIENHKRLPVPVLEVAFHIPRELVFSDFENTSVSDFVYKRDIFSILGNQRIIRRLPVDCRKRGHFHVEKVDFTTYSMLYHSRYSAAQPVEVELYVYAARTDVSELMVQFERMLGPLQCAKRMYEDPFAFRGIREYTRTDPMKTINWKASAKTGELMVNTFDSTITERVMLCLDLQDTGIIRHERLVEEGISVAASFAEKLIARGMEVGLAVNVAKETEDTDERSNGFGKKEGESYINLQPASGRSQLTRIERFLARRTPDEPTLSFAELLTRPADDAILVLISRNINEIQSALKSSGVLAHAAKDQNPVLWILPYGDDRDVLPKSGGGLVVYPRKVVGG